MLRYVTTWFAADVTLVSLDWMELFLTKELRLSFQSIGSARVFRVLRLVRLLRVLRMRHVLGQFFERVNLKNSEKIGLAAGVFKQLLGVLGVTHFVACIWFWLGTQSGRGWVTAEGFKDVILSYQYSTSFHWALCQLTGGMDEIHPHTTGERCFNIVIFIIGFTLAGIFISSLTSTSTLGAYLKSPIQANVCIATLSPAEGHIYAPHVASLPKCVLLFSRAGALHL